MRTKSPHELAESHVLGLRNHFGSLRYALSRFDMSSALFANHVAASVNGTTELILCGRHSGLKISWGGEIRVEQCACVRDRQRRERETDGQTDRQRQRGRERGRQRERETGKEAETEAETGTETGTDRQTLY